MFQKWNLALALCPQHPCRAPSLEAHGQPPPHISPNDPHLPLVLVWLHSPGACCSLLYSEFTGGLLGVRKASLNTGSQRLVVQRAPMVGRHDAELLPELPKIQPENFSFKLDSHNMWKLGT